MISSSSATKLKRSFGPLVNHPIFLGSLVLKIIMIGLVLPKTQSEWFIPFITQTVAQPFPDPWSVYLSQGGSLSSFPYGIVMYVVYVPLTGLGYALNNLFHIQWLAKVGFGLTSLALDLGILMSLALLLKTFPKTLFLATYWCSPIVIYIAYWHGQVDLLPIFLLVLGIYLLESYRPILSGVAIGLAISSKFSVLIAVPFLLVYLYRNNRLRNDTIRVGTSILVTATLTFVPFLLSDAFVQMTVLTKETARLFQVSLSYGDSLQFFLLPPVYMLVLYLTWRIERITLDLFIISVGLGFFSTLLMLPPASGWFMWVVPFLVWYQIKAKQNYLWLTFLFYGAYVCYSLAYSTGATIPSLQIDLSRPFLLDTRVDSARVQSLSFTVLNSIALLLCIRMYIFGVRRNGYYRASRKPMAIGISGDSGAGKDTLVDALVDVLGDRGVTSISGDDYHKWERHHPMWSTKTHLDPHANDLSKLTQDVSILLDGASVKKRIYNHQNGKFTPPISSKPKDFLIVSGLHTLYLHRLREHLDLKIFLDTDDELRFFWKTHRDLAERNYANGSVSLALAQRIEDSQKFIRSQEKYAELIFKLAPLSPIDVSDRQRSPRLKLVVKMANGFFHEELIRHLIALCGMQVDIEQSEDLEFIDITIEGDVSSEDISTIAPLIIPNLNDLVARIPLWAGGYIGIMQLVILAHVADVLHRGRRLS